jgi:hypothetical protein
MKPSLEAQMPLGFLIQFITSSTCIRFRGPGCKVPPLGTRVRPANSTPLPGELNSIVNRLPECVQQRRSFAMCRCV